MASEEKWSNMEGSSSSKAGRSLCVLLAFVASNFVALYVGISWHPLTSPPCFPSSFSNYVNPAEISMARPLLATLTSQLNLTQAELHVTRQELSQLKQHLKASEDLCKTLLASGCTSPNSSSDHQQPVEVPWTESITPLLAQSDELREYTAVQNLPLGWSSGIAAMSMVSPIGHSCGSEANKVDLSKYMRYERGGICPDDQALAHTLTVHGCEPLPRRRCFARGPPHFEEPLPLPDSLWSTPSDESILWTPYTCKSFECLNERKKKKVFEDCIDCFELHGREKQRWTKHASELDFSIHEVLLFKPGTIRIGLDIGGGSGTFAVRMREENVTIVTTSLNLNGPFNNFIALRGVVPLFLTIGQRFPFFDNTLDIVHSMHVLSNWIPTQTLEFLLFDIDRVLRPGGLFWLDHFFCIKNQLDDVYMPLIEKLGYQKLRWAVGLKLDRGPELQEVYLSALLEKPMSRI